MSASDSSNLPMLSIGGVERETGLSKDTLRVWERRYKFPQPERDQSGERVYPLEQVEKLRLVKRLLDQGHRPAKVIGFSVNELRALAGQPDADSLRESDGSEAREDLRQYIALCKDHQLDEMRRRLSQVLLRLGMHRFVVEVIAPLTSLVGTQWANGHVAVFEEHLYTESVQGLLRNAIATIPRPLSIGPRPPRVLLTTFPQEQHGLGLLMAEAIFALEGAHCISLGLSTPVMEIAQAASAQKADIVALSFSAAMNPNHALQGLGDLRARLSENTEIWIGGRCPLLYRRPPPTARVVELHEIHDLLAEWGTGHGGNAHAGP
jgi:DNA-binding transcriptional MerR regulator